MGNHWVYHTILGIQYPLYPSKMNQQNKHKINQKHHCGTFLTCSVGKTLRSSTITPLSSVNSWVVLCFSIANVASSITTGCKRFASSGTNTCNAAGRPSSLSPVSPARSAIFAGTSCSLVETSVQPPPYICMCVCVCVCVADSVAQ